MSLNGIWKFRVYQPAWDVQYGRITTPTYLTDHQQHLGWAFVKVGAVKRLKKNHKKSIACLFRGRSLPTYCWAEWRIDFWKLAAENKEALPHEGRPQTESHSKLVRNQKWCAAILYMRIKLVHSPMDYLKGQYTRACWEPLSAARHFPIMIMPMMFHSSM